MADFEQKLFKEQLGAAPCDSVKAAETKQAEGARTAHGAKAKEIAKMEQRHNVTYASTM